MEEPIGLTVSVLPMKKRHLPSLEWAVNGSEQMRQLTWNNGKTTATGACRVDVIDKSVGHNWADEEQEEEDLSPNNVMHFPSSAKLNSTRAADSLGFGLKRARINSQDDTTDVPSLRGSRVDDEPTVSLRDESCIKDKTGKSLNEKKRPRHSMKGSHDDICSQTGSKIMAYSKMKVKSSLRSLLHEWVDDLRLKIDISTKRNEVADLFVSLTLHIYTRFLLRKYGVRTIAGLCGASVRKTDLAACLWIAMKLEEEQAIVPTSQEIAEIAGIIDKKVLGLKEVEIGNLLEWRLLEGWRPIIQPNECSDSTDGETANMCDSLSDELS